ncbi:MAG: protein phosphatase 2C domain-containing protein, partial [Patescibacteria group bacterium]
AQLMAYFAVKEITAMLLMGSTIDRIADALYSRCLGYLHAIASLTSAGNPQEAVSFVSNYLCCTIVGFVMDDESAVIFSAGDGVIMIDDRINRINQDDRPSYLGLSLVDSRFLKLDGVELPKSFNIQEIELGQINRFAVCTDGVTDGILKQVFGLAGPHSGPLGLQRKLRVLTLREEPVEDDCTVITIELNEPEADKLVIELAVSDDCKEKEVER